MPENAMATHRMDTSTKTRLRHAAEQASLHYPGPVGELLRQELLSWMVFGPVLGSALIMRLVDDLADTTQSKR